MPGWRKPFAAAAAEGAASAHDAVRGGKALATSASGLARSFAGRIARICGAGCPTMGTVTFAAFDSHAS